jgi:hypothetical protein
VAEILYHPLPAEIILADINPVPAPSIKVPVEILNKAEHWLLPCENILQKLCPAGLA